MKPSFTMRTAALTPALILGAVTTVALADDHKMDFGQMVEHQLEAKSVQLFGFDHSLPRPADETNYVAREAATSASQRILLAKGLKAEFVTRHIASPADMIAFWPNASNPTHLMVCIEGSRATDGINASIQRVELETGTVETILYGMSRCDGIRTTDWGTVLATEESDDGRAYEIINPLTTTGHWVESRDLGIVRDGLGSSTTSSHIVQRPDLPTMSWEGLTVQPSGVVIGGDELRPGSGTNDTDGGAIFKFVPEVPRTDDNTISDLADSPLAAGTAYAMQVSCRDDRQQYGQGCEVGNAAWIQIDPLNARADANDQGATGYYRPEDLHSDPTYSGEGVRFCWTNTGNEGAKHYSEVICGVDAEPLVAEDDNRTVVVNRFVEGDTRFNSADNLEIQPKTGNVYVVEDHQYGEIWACLPDGDDSDIKTDGCLSMISVIDPQAEPTGFIFDASGETAYVNIQHGECPVELQDFDSNPVNGCTDDLIKITGFK